MARIGNPDSAAQRVRNFVARVYAYTGYVPTRVIVFAEDFEALDPTEFVGEPYTVECGPSIAEYVIRRGGEP